MRVRASAGPFEASDAGYSLIEAAVALVLALIVTGAALSMLVPNSSAGRTQPDAVDQQQRARVGADMLARDLYLAGAGVSLGPATGPLRRFFAPVVPRRAGLQNADDYTVARSDAITILYVPHTWSQTTLRDPLAAGADLRVEDAPNCPAGAALCGMGPGASVLVFDRLGHFDAFTVTSLLGDAGRLRSWQSGQQAFSYPAGSIVTRAEWHTYYLDSATRQLRHFDGYLTDTPVVDDVVGLTFEYFGDPSPPRAPRPPPGTASCLFDTGGALNPGLAVLPAQGSLSELPLSLFRDGPWCGDGQNRYDADLLRIRMVRVLLRFQVGNDMLRGASSEHAVAGRSLSALRSLPDYRLRFDLSPRNMGWNRAW